MEDITENAWSGNPISDAACGEYLHKVAEPSWEIAVKQGPGEYNMYLPSKSKVNTICGDLITPHTYEPRLVKLVVQFVIQPETSAAIAASVAVDHS